MRRLPLLIAAFAAACDIHGRDAARDSAARSARSGDSAARGATSSAASAAPRASGDTTPPKIVRHDVIANGATGARARVRWALAPDHLALLVMADAVSVENDPLPNGVVYASETRSAVVQIDGVWDAAPSPDWHRLAIGRAFLAQPDASKPPARGAAHSSPATWSALAARLAALAVKRGAPPARERTLAREYAEQLARASFSASGMADRPAAAATYVVALDSLPTGARAALTDTLPPAAFGGWRVRWLAPNEIAIGIAPGLAADDAPATAWRVVPVIGADSIGPAAAGAPDTTRFAPSVWQDGPSIEPALEFSYAPRTVEAGTVRVESRGGTIYLTRRDDRAPLVVGPGIPLAATANGRFIAAIAPRDSSSAAGSAAGSAVVVYEVIP